MTTECFFGRLTSKSSMLVRCLRVSNNHPSLSLKEFSVLLENLTTMHNIVHEVSHEENPHVLLKNIILTLLNIKSIGSEGYMWKHAGDMDHFQNIILSEEFIDRCLNTSECIKVVVDGCSIGTQTKPLLMINSNPMKIIHRELSIQRNGQEIQELMDNSDDHVDTKEEYWAALENYMKEFSKHILFVCYVYDMCIVREKLFTQCFSFDRTQPEDPSKPTISLIGRLSERRGTTANSPTHHEETDSDEEVIGKRSTPPNSHKSQKKKRKIHTDALDTLKRMNQEMEQRLMFSPKGNLKKLMNSVTYRTVDWSTRMIILLLFTQKAAHETRNLHPVDILQEHEHFDIDHHTLTGGPMPFYILPPWYFCIIKNIVALSKSTKKPFKTQTIRSLSDLCNDEDRLGVILGLAQDANSSSETTKKQIGTQIKRAISTTHKIIYPEGPDPQTQQTADVITNYAMYHCVPLHVNDT